MKKSQLRTSCHDRNHGLRKDKDKSTGAVAVVNWRRQVRCSLFQKTWKTLQRNSLTKTKTMGVRKTLTRWPSQCFQHTAIFPLPVKFACHAQLKFLWSLQIHNACNMDIYKSNTIQMWQQSSATGQTMFFGGQQLSIRAGFTSRVIALNSYKL